MICYPMQRMEKKKETFEKRRQFEELAHEKKWYHNSKFKVYANKIYRKLFK